MTTKVINIIGGAIVAFTAVFTVLGKLDLTQFGLINTAVFSALYGYREKNKHDETKRELFVTLFEKEDLTTKYVKLANESKDIQKVANDLHAKYIEATNELISYKASLESTENFAKDTPVEKPKRTRTKKDK